jgi:23S rRNA (uracil1939-C5)-methyltransferase
MRAGEELLEPRKQAALQSVPESLGGEKLSAGPAELSAPAVVKRTEARVVDVDAEGRGLAEIGGMPVLVDGALEGERVAIDKLRKRRRFNEARLVEVLERSPQRAQPSCEYFHLCGGCRFQHLKLEAQQARKQRILEQALSASGVAAPQKWFPPMTGPELRYRRKARLGVKFVPGKGGALVGFREKRGRFIADIHRCEVLVPSVGERIQALRELVSGLSAPDRIPQIEIAAGDDATALVLRHLDPVNQKDRVTLREFTCSQGLSIYLQPGGIDTIVPLWPQNPPPLRYRIPEFNLELAFEPTDFVQVNAAVNRALVSRAVSWLNPGPSDRVLDLYSGMGNFSLALARHGGWVSGVEASANMVSAARRNAESNAIANASFEVADLENPAEVAQVLGGEFSAMLLDPPRSGAAHVVEQLASPYPLSIVYVSCNPESFARDAAVVTQRHGYRLESAGIVDMFPHTGHLELIARFSRVTR